jgi:hypothetical protein
MFAVLDNNKPASEEGFPKLKGHGWVTHKFVTLLGAQEYANHWLGQWAPGRRLELNEVYDYNGYGDLIVIVEVDNEPLSL